jgi:hypothetical protein
MSSSFETLFNHLYPLLSFRHNVVIICTHCCHLDIMLSSVETLFNYVIVVCYDWLIMFQNIILACLYLFKIMLIIYYMICILVLYSIGRLYYR